MNVRQYDSRDWDDICRMHDSARMKELSLVGLEKAFIPLEIASEREGLFEYNVLVAEDNGKVLGFCAFSDEELAWLYVAPSETKKGIGSTLIKAALEKEPGIYYIEVLFGNEPAKSLYEKFGFKVRNIARGKMPGNEDFEVSAYCMERIIK